MPAEDSVKRAARASVAKPVARKRTKPAAPPAQEANDIVNVRRRQDRSVATRDKILAAALQEFATLSFDGATTRSIAVRAEVPHGLVVYHYETKLAVWQAVIERALGDFHDRYLQTIDSLQGSDPEVVLRAIYSDFIRMSASRPELGWMLSYEVAGQSDRVVWLLEQIGRRDVEITRDLIRELQASGRFVQGDPVHLHFMFLGAATRVFSLAAGIEHHIGMSPFDKDFIERHIELCLSLFLRSPPSTP